MKLFHISDLHIGKILHEVNLLEEQKIVLAQVLALVDSSYAGWNPDRGRYL